MSFTHDGVRDNLTHLAAPPYFYENLKRELIGFERSGHSISLLRFALNPAFEIDLESEEGDALVESAALNFSQLIMETLRREDLCARLGLTEFVLIVSGNEELVSVIAHRIATSWSDDNFQCLHASVLARRGESSLELLNRLDNETLT